MVKKITKKRKPNLQPNIGQDFEMSELYHFCQYLRMGLWLLQNLKSGCKFRSVFSCYFVTFSRLISSRPYRLVYKIFIQKSFFLLWIKTELIIFCQLLVFMSSRLNILYFRQLLYHHTRLRPSSDTTYSFTISR